VIQLRTPWNDGAALATAVKRANSALTAECAAVDRIADRFRLHGRLPESYKRSIWRPATGFTIDVNLDGAIFAVAETSEGISGGAVGSCIPNNTLVQLLNIWTEQQRQPVQGSLF